MARFLALLWNPDGDRRAAATAIADAAAFEHDLSPRLDIDGCILVADADGGVRLADEAGYILGHVFPREDAAQRPQLTECAEAMRIRRSATRHLIDQYWGSYVALVRNEAGDAFHILRDPTGAVPCFRLERQGLTMLASDLSLFPIEVLSQMRIDWSFVAQLAAYPHLRGERTGIAGIDEVMPGCCATIGSRPPAPTCLWTPWTFTSAARRITDFEEASTRLRHEIIQCVRALARPYRRILLELSGGLDSSILAAALSTAGAPCTGLNLATDDAEGDEVRYARVAAKRSGLPLVERTALGIGTVDMTRPARPKLARPGAQAWLQAWEYRFVETARDEECDVFFSGTGGDNVFCSLFSGAPAADLLRTGNWTGFPAAVGELARIHEASVWKVLGLSLRSAARRAPRARWPGDMSFLAAAQTITEPDEQPWLQAPTPVLPGTRAHVRSILATIGHQGGSSRDLHAPSVTPLLAQPVQELCLRIPSWLWVRGGRDRAVARHAFRDLLPPEIYNRRTKGMIDGYCLRLTEHNRLLLRSMLADGHLVAQGILDRTQLTGWFDQPRPARDISYFRILSLVDIEIWLRDWLGAP